MDKHITLSKEELRELKDDAADDAVFRYKILHGLKMLEKRFDNHEDTSSIFREKVTSIRTQVFFQWFLLSGVVAYIWFIVRK